MSVSLGFCLYKVGVKTATFMSRSRNDLSYMWKDIAGTHINHLLMFVSFAVSDDSESVV